MENKLPYRPEEREIEIKKRIESIFAPSREIHLEIIERRIGIMKGSFQVNVGIYNGEILPSDDYWFSIDVTDNENLTKTYKGHFSLIRR